VVDVGGFEIPVSMPSFSFGFNSTIWYLILLIIFIVIIGGVGLFMMQRLRVYNKKIVVFENIAGQGFQPVYKDRARLVKLGDGGEELMYLLKKKVYRTAYGKKMGKNTYWFAIGQDGYWYNVVLGDVDAKMGMLDIEPIDRDMRYMHVAIRKNIQDRYKKVGIMEKYGVYIFSAIFLLIIILGNWFILDKIADINMSSASTVEAATEVQVATGNLLVSLDNIISRLDTKCIQGGSGIVSAT